MAKWQYGVVIDAGSSGSRVHVYRWLKAAIAREKARDNELDSLPVVKTKKHWTKKIHPGVSTFGSKPDLVGPDHLRILLDHALDNIPPESVSETPVFLLATAGVRLLPSLERKELLKQICSYTRSHTDLLLTDCDAQIQAIPGDAEGLYGWVAANYLLGGFDSPSSHDHGQGHHTYGFLDMGGASAQIAFAPNTTETEKHAQDLKLLRLRSVKGAVSEYRVFVTTWLEFGVHQARRRYVEALMDSALPVHGEYPDPCLPKGLTISTSGDILTPDKIKGQEIHLLGTGQFKECLSSTYPLLGKDKICMDPPCLLNGVHAPAIDFGTNHFVGVSEYWHTTHEIFEYAYSDKAYDFKTYQERVRNFCTQDWGSIRKGVENQLWGKKVDEATAVELCFKASWLINVLHDGIGIPRVGLERLPSDGHNGTKKLLEGVKEKGFMDPFQAVQKIDDTEVSWTLGKMVLYAASEVLPMNTNTLPVGFGSNSKDIPPDWQFAGIRAPTRPVNDTSEHNQVEIEGWRDTLFDGKAPRRVPGFLLFILIICIAVFLLCGKERRFRLYNKVFSRFAGGSYRHGRRGRNIYAKKLLSKSGPAHTGQHERLLESGINEPDDFELGLVDGHSDNEYSDSSSGSKKGKASGWATPTIRAPKVDAVGGDVLGSAGPSVQGNAMDRSGLFVRTDSRDQLHGLGPATDRRSRSRRGSPTRLKSPLTRPLAED